MLVRETDRLAVRPAQRASHWGLIGLLVVVFAAWAWNLGYGEYTGDEYFVVRFIQQPAGEILRRLNTDEPHPPLYYLMMRGWRLLENRSDETLMRLPSLFVGLLLLSLTYRLARDLGLGLEGALAAVGVLAVTPQMLEHIREVRMYGLMTVGVVAAALVGWRFSRLPRRWAVPAAALASLLALFSQYFSVLFIGPLVLWGIGIFRGDTRRRWILAQGIAFGALALWLPLMGRGFFNPTSLQQGKTWSFLLPPWETLWQVLEVGAFGYRDYLYVGWAAAGGALLAVAALAGSVVAGRPSRWLVLCMVAVPLAAYAGLCAIKPLYHPKYVVPWLVFAALAIGALVARWRAPGLGVCVALVALMAWPAWRTLSLPYPADLRLTRDRWLPPPAERDLAHALDPLMGPTDTFGLGTPDWLPCFYTQNYLPRNLGCTLLPASPEQTVGELVGQIDQTLSAHRVLWFMRFYNPAWDPHHVTEAALSQSSLFLGTESLAGRSFDLYASPQRLLREQTPIGVRLGDAAVLEGAWLMRGPALRLVLIWTVLPGSPAGLKVFVHERDATDAMIAQADQDWLEGAQRFGPHLFTVSTLPLPDGQSLTSHTFSLGLYDGGTLARLPAYRPAGERLPDDAVVVPMAALLQP
jgi:hypothetical protein